MSTWLEKAGVATRLSSTSVAALRTASASNRIRPPPSAIRWLSKNLDRYPVACCINWSSRAVLSMPKRSMASITPSEPSNASNAR